MIPPLLIRTVPADTSPQVEKWWERFGRIHPTWDLHTHREPLDPSAWPLTSDLWDRCRSGAQKAGLVRLEALWSTGGVYVDSDVEPYRPLDPLLALPGFAAWEDANCVPDAVLGFAPTHPAVGEMLTLARRRLTQPRNDDWATGTGAWSTGPGVTTTVLPGRSDVLLLPPGSFYPYHYSRKRQDARKDHMAAQPWCFCAHHWHHSWAGS